MLPQLASNLIMLGIPTDGWNNTIPVLGLSLLAFAAYLLIACLFIFKPGYLVRKLKLDEKFLDDTIAINISQNQLLNIVIILIGGITFINALPTFIRFLLEFLKQKEILNKFPDVTWLVFEFITLLIGYLLMTNSKFIAHLISKQAE
jgi:hypothetical protein